jgi:hypothetical protein
MVCRLWRLHHDCQAKLAAERKATYAHIRLLSVGNRGL